MIPLCLGTQTRRMMLWILTRTEAAVPPSPADTSPDLEGRRLFRYEQVGVSFSDESIKKICSMSFSNSGTLWLLLGIRAWLFSALQVRIRLSLMSFKAHKGWVARSPISPDWHT